MATMTLTTEDRDAIGAKLESIRIFLAETPGPSLTLSDVHDMVTDITDCISLIVFGVPYGG